MQPRYLGGETVLAGAASPSTPGYGSANPIILNIRRRRFINLFVRVYGTGTDTVKLTAYAAIKETGASPVVSFGTSGVLSVAYSGSEIRQFITVEVHNHDVGIFITGATGGNLNANVNVEFKITDSNNL